MFLSDKADPQSGLKERAMRMDKLTHSLQAALGEAQSLAIGRDHPFIEPLHLLKAMMDPATSAARALLLDCSK